MRYRFKGFVRSTGQPVEGHAHGQAPDEALQSLSEHGIITESLREEPEMAAPADGSATPLRSAVDSALDTASQQVPFDELANKFKGKSVWVLDRDKIRRRVAQVVDSALRQAMSDHGESAGGMNDVREQVAEAISGLFKDNRNLTSQVSNTSMQLENQIKRIEMITRRSESVLAQMTIAISRMGSGGFGGGGGGGPRRYAGGAAPRNEQNAVLMEIFKENLRLRGIEIDEGASAAAATADVTPSGEGPAEESAQPSSDTPPASNGNGVYAADEAQNTSPSATAGSSEPERIQPPTPQPVAAVEVTLSIPEGMKSLPPAHAHAPPLKQWTTDL